MECAHCRHTRLYCEASRRGCCRDCGGNPEAHKRVIAWLRAERDRCEAGTKGCCINHGRDDGPCETW